MLPSWSLLRNRLLLPLKNVKLNSTQAANSKNVPNDNAVPSNTVEDNGVFMDVESEEENS